jgi:uncharacterized protein (DUF1778 family)
VIKAQVAHVALNQLWRASMAKKQVSKDAQKEVQLKVRLSPEEHKDVRVAAAEMELTISDFLRNAVLAYSQRGVAEYVQRGMNKAASKPNSREG